MSCILIIIRNTCVCTNFVEQHQHHHHLVEQHQHDAFGPIPESFVVSIPKAYKSEFFLCDTN
jgi:hypothetical protein